MATQNAIDNTSNPISTTAMTIDPGASGDSYIQYDINTTGEFRMGVDDTDDSFRIAVGSALGTADALVVESTGEVLAPTTPLFSAKSSLQSSVSGSDVSYTIIYGTEDFDQGGDYNSTTGVFTAPVAGIYQFVWSLRTGSLDTGNTNFRPLFHKNSAATYFPLVMQETLANGQDVSGEYTVCFGAIVELAASDTFETVMLTNGGSVNILADSRFGGALVA